MTHITPFTTSLPVYAHAKRLPPPAASFNAVWGPFPETPDLWSCHFGQRAYERSSRGWFGIELDLKHAPILLESGKDRRHDRNLAELKFRPILKGLRKRFPRLTSQSRYIDCKQMTLLKRLKTTPAPPVLYHYTTQAGLLGILQDNCIWATAAHYLNDSSEYRYGLQHIAEGLLEGSKKAISKQEAANLSAIAQQTLSPFWSVCVVSLTSKGDLLSQWRAYAGGSGGFALGLHSKYLRKAAHRQGFYLVRCIYTQADQQQAIGKLIQEFRERMTTSPIWGPTEQGGCVATAMRLAIMLKDRSFAKEREWRLISMPKIISELHFRQGTSMLVPFFKFALEEHKNAYLDSVRVGPTPHRELAVNSVRMLLRKLELSDPEDKVTETRIPFRNW